MKESISHLIELYQTFAELWIALVQLKIKGDWLVGAWDKGSGHWWRHFCIKGGEY
jgi:hypothetical protein